MSLTFKSRLTVIFSPRTMLSLSVDHGSDSSLAGTIGQLILLVLMACSNASRDSAKTN